MKRLFFFIYFIFVNVSINALKESYKREIFKTNQLFEIALKMNDCTVGDKVIKNGLEHVIKTIVLEDLYNLGDLNHIFVTPERPYAYKQWSKRDSLELHRTLQNKIINELKIADDDVTNIITAALKYSNTEVAARDVFNINYEMLVFQNLSEDGRQLAGNQLPDIVRQTLDYEEFYFKVLGEDGRRNTKIMLREKNIQKLDREETDFQTLGEDCRRLTGMALKNIVSQIIDRHTKMSILFDLRMKCYLIALLLSTKNPTNNLTTIRDKDWEACVVVIKNNDSDNSLIAKTFVYREFEGIWWKVNSDNFNEKLQMLRVNLI